jgi:CHASE2 domain-containing sensor protein
MAQAAHRRTDDSWRWLVAYWVTAAAVLLLTLWTEPFIDAHLNLKAERNWLFQTLSANPNNRVKAGQARLVVLDDEAFWKGDLHHRLPTDRHYIARLVRALDAADASVIALDLDLGAPSGGAPVKPNDFSHEDTYYGAETDDLMKAVADVAQRRKVVLGDTLDGPDNGPFIVLNQVYNAYGICSRLTADGVWENPGSARQPLTQEAQRNISCGYIDLMDDPRRIPPPARLANQPWRPDSFPMAIARASDPSSPPPRDAPPLYGRYIDGDLTKNAAIAISADVVLKDPVKAREVLHSRPALIGGVWSQYGFGLGDRVDTHPTPIGDAPGVLLHENLVESALAGRMLRGLDENTSKGLEIAVSVAAAVFFAAFASFRAKLAACLAAIGGLFLIQWFVLGQFAFFFEAFVPVLALSSHTLIDRLIAGSEEEPVAPAIATLTWLKRAWRHYRDGASHAQA